jgi:hypothetical protein
MEITRSSSPGLLGGRCLPTVAMYQYSHHLDGPHGFFLLHRRSFDCNCYEPANISYASGTPYIRLGSRYGGEAQCSSGFLCDIDGLIPSRGENGMGLVHRQLCPLLVQQKIPHPSSGKTEQTRLLPMKLLGCNDQHLQPATGSIPFQNDLFVSKPISNC